MHMPTRFVPPLVPTRVVPSLVLAAAGWLASTPAQAVELAIDPIRVELFTEYAEAVDHINLFDKFAEQTAASIAFGLQSPWWPRGDQLSFGARLTSGLQVDSAGSYTLALGGDDATYLFIDGQLVLSQPGNHAYFTSTVNLSLAAGVHTMELQFYNGPCCGSVLTLDTGGLAYVPGPVPEPTTLALWLAGLAWAGFAAHRRGGAAG